MRYTVSEKILIGAVLEKINNCLIRYDGCSLPSGKHIDRGYGTTSDLLISFDEESKQIFDGLLKKYQII